MVQSVEISVVSSNICCNPIRNQLLVRRRIAQAAHFLPRSFNNGSEIQIPRYKRAWKAFMKRYGKKTYGLHTEVPISVPVDFVTVYHSFHRIHAGKEGVSPSRYVTELRGSYHGFNIAYLACHPVSEGYVGKKGHVHQWNWRHEHLKLYQRWVNTRAARLTDMGYTVIVAGDMNDPHHEMFLNQSMAVAHSGLDWIYVIPTAGHKITRHRAHHIAPTRYMDHPIIGASFTLTATDLR